VEPLRRFGRFWYGFLVGDDWIAALGVAVALGITALVSGQHNPWWFLPVAVAGILVVSVRRGARRAAPVSPPESTAPVDD
jgi:hypothetical protein